MRHASLRIAQLHVQISVPQGVYIIINTMTALTSAQSGFQYWRVIKVDLYISTFCTAVSTG